MAKASPNLTADQINRILRDYIESALAASDPTRKPPAWKRPGSREEERDGFDLAWDSVASDLHDFDDFKFAEPLARELIEKHDLPLAEDSEEYRAFCRRVAQAELERTKLEQERLDAYYGPIVASVSPPSAQSVAQEPEAAPSPPMSEVLPKYIAEMTREAWTKKTRQQTMHTFNMFIHVVGDLPIADVTREHVASFRATLARMPRIYGKSARDRGASIEELTTRPGPRLSEKTIKRHLTSLNGFFSWAKMTGLREGDSPAAGFKFRKSKRAREERAAWELEDLQKLFGSPVWTGCMSPHRRSLPGDVIVRDSLYWIPLIGLYSGLRLEEAAQLRVEDIQKDKATGICFFDIRTGDGRQLKTKASVRKVPVHSALIHGGLLEAHAEALTSGAKLMFPELTPGGPDQRMGANLTKKFGTYRRAIGLTERDVGLHALRATFTTTLLNAGVPEAVSAELLGHEEGMTITYGRYAKGVSLDVLQRAVETASYPGISVPPPTS